MIDSDLKLSKSWLDNGYPKRSRMALHPFLRHAVELQVALLRTAPSFSNHGHLAQEIG